MGIEVRPSPSRLVSLSTTPQLHFPWMWWPTRAAKSITSFSISPTATTASPAKRGSNFESRDEASSGPETSHFESTWSLQTRALRFQSQCSSGQETKPLLAQRLDHFESISSFQTRTLQVDTRVQSQDQMHSTSSTAETTSSRQTNASYQTTLPQFRSSKIWPCDPLIKRHQFDNSSLLSSQRSGYSVVGCW